MDRLQQLTAAWTTATLLRLRAADIQHGHDRDGDIEAADLETGSGAVITSRVPARVAATFSGSSV